MYSVSVRPRVSHGKRPSGEVSHHTAESHSGGCTWMEREPQSTLAVIHGSAHIVLDIASYMYKANPALRQPLPHASRTVSTTKGFQASWTKTTHIPKAADAAPDNCVTLDVSRNCSPLCELGSHDVAHAKIGGQLLRLFLSVLDFPTTSVSLLDRKQVGKSFSTTLSTEVDGFEIETATHAGRQR